MYVQAMDGDGTSRRAATGGHEVFAAMMMVSEDKNKNTLVVARAKRGARLGCQKQRSIIIIEPDPSSALPLVLSAVLGTFQSLAAPPPRAVSSSQTLVSSSHILPSTTTATTEGQGTSPAAAAAILSYPALSCTTTVRPTTRLARFARTGVSWSLRLNRCFALPQATTHSPPPRQRSAFTTTAASKPAHHLRPDSFRLPDHRPPSLNPPPHSPHRPPTNRSPATAGPRILFFPHPYLTRSLPLVHHSFHSSAACFIFPSPTLPSFACDLVVVPAAIRSALAAHQTSPV